MNNRGQIVLVVAGVAVLAAVAVLEMALGSREPVYDGKSISEWLKQPAIGNGGFFPDFEILTPHFPHLESNALPYLLKTLRKTDGPIHKPYVALFARLPWSVRRHLPQPWDAAGLRANAAFALGELGRSAEPAVPALITMTKKDEDAGARACAAQALGEIGDDRPAVMNALAAAQGDTNAWVGFAAQKARARLDHTKP